MNELALFAGAGGGILGGKLLGWRTVCAVERDAYCAQVLAQRQNDGLLEPFPIWSDVCSFDGKPWRGLVDVVSGGFPCQDISSAGKGAGIGGERSGLWREMVRIISEVRPRFALVENSPLLVGRGAALVIGDLTEMGYDAEWCCISASDLGAPHERDRFWLLAHSNSDGLQERVHVGGACGQASGREQQGRQADGVFASQDIADTDSGQRSLGGAPGRVGRINKPISWHGDWPIASEPVLDRGADEVANRLDRLKAIGNGQVPIVAATAFRILANQ